jgi:hypothetical protein
MTKYHAQKVHSDDGVFASKAEYRRWCELKLMLAGKLISSLTRQPSYDIVVNGHKVCRYVADFAYQDDEGNPVVEDVKGFKTAVYRLKKKLMLAVHGIAIRETK